MNNNCIKKNKNYYNCNYNNFYPINNKSNIYFCNKNNKFNKKLTNPLYEVENFLCNIKQLSKCIKIIKYFK